MSYLVCGNCNGYYKLQKDESIEDYERCQCGGKLRHYKSLYEFVDAYYGLNYYQIIKEKERLENEHTQLEEIYNQLDDNYFKQAKEYKNLKMINADFESEKGKLKESYGSLKLEHDNLNDNYNKLKEELDGLKKENKSLLDNQSSPHAELEDLKKHNEELKDKNAELEDNLNELKNKLSENPKLENLKNAQKLLNKNFKSNELKEKLEGLKGEKGNLKFLENKSDDYEELNAAYNLLLEMFTKLKEENSKLKELKKNEDLNLNSIIIRDNGIKSGK
jgi:chromosome segregation ATPase